MFEVSDIILKMAKPAFSKASFMSFPYALRPMSAVASKYSNFFITIPPKCKKYISFQMLSLFAYICTSYNFKLVIKMFGNKDTTLQVDLRKKSSVKDEIIYSNLDIQSCMVVLVVIAGLLLSVISVVAAQAPII
jgi:hypothetical protein